MLIITSLYAALAGLFYVYLSLNVSLLRNKTKQSLGDGGDDVLCTRIRQHANFAEYTPITLILLGLCEGMGASQGILHIAGITLLVTRAMHFYGLGNAKGYRARRYGIILCYVLLLALSLGLLAQITF